MTSGPNLLAVAELSARHAAGELSPVEVTEAALSAIETYEPEVNAFVLVDADSARRAAAESERRWEQGRPLSPVDGVPTPIKDIFLTRGWPTLRGSRLIDPSGPWEVDSPVVARLREAGCVFLGKTTTPEFAWKGVTDSPKDGATGNPWGPRLTSGGSSGGSATAVGLGMGSWSVGSDGGGSVRIPASFTGTVALKPTYGLVPWYPASPFGTLAHAGPMTRNVTDAALMLDVLAAFDARDWSALPVPSASFTDGLDDGVRGLRVGFSPDLGLGVDNDPAVEAAVRTAVDALADAGADVADVAGADLRLPHPADAFDVLWSTGAAKVVEPYGDEALTRLDPGLAECVRRGRERSASDYLDAVAVRMEWGRVMGELHERIDVLVTPTMPMAAFAAGEPAPAGAASDYWPTWTPYTYPFNLTQQPAISVPCGVTADGRPIGLQLVGARHADALVLRAARAYEAATDWHTRRPPLLDRT